MVKFSFWHTVWYQRTNFSQWKPERMKFSSHIIRVPSAVWPSLLQLPSLLRRCHRPQLSHFRRSGVGLIGVPVSREQTLPFPVRLNSPPDSIRMPCNLPLPACLPACNVSYTLTRNEKEEEEVEKNSLFDGRLFGQPSTIQLWKTKSISSTATAIPSIPRIRHYWLIAFCARNTPSTLGTPYRRLERGTTAVKWNIINQIQWRCCSLFVPP